MHADRESLPIRRRSLIAQQAEPSQHGYQASELVEEPTLENNNAATFAQQLAASTRIVTDALPASKAQVRRDEAKIDRDEVLIQQLINKVNFLTPVSLQRHQVLFSAMIRFCCNCVTYSHFQRRPRDAKGQ